VIITPQRQPGRRQGIPYFTGDSRSYCKPFVNSLLFLILSSFFIFDAAKICISFLITKEKRRKYETII
jgi:hypothetical protein